MNYSDTTSALVINKLTKSQYETLKASGSLQSNQIYITPETLPSNLGDFNNDVGYVTASAVAASYATKSEVETISASVSTMASSISGKRDYLDLTYSTTVPSETIDNSELHWEDTDVEYNAKLTFTVNDSVKGEEHLVWNDGETCWIDNAMQKNFMVWYAEDFGYDPADGKFVLVDGADACLQFNLQDGVNVQTFNYESGNYQSTGTLTMTFTGEPAHVVSDTLALDSNLEVVSASVSTLSSQVTSLSSQVGENASAISANTSAISAMASNFTVSGIGCSTIVLSGTYSDSTSFAYNIVVQPSASV